jgi:hypothetical protein
MEIINITADAHPILHAQLDPQPPELQRQQILKSYAAPRS